MSTAIADLIEQYGTAIVFLNVLLDQLGLPIPAVPTLIGAGALAAGGRLSLTALMSLSVLACLMADCGWYLIGRHYGIRVLRTLCRISIEPDSCVSQTQSRFERWGVNALIVAKFVPGLAIIAPPLAGAMRIGWPRFLLLSTLGAALWSGAGLLLGVLFNNQVGYVLAHLAGYGRAAGLVLGGALALYIGFKWWERSRFYAELRMARITVDALYGLMSSGADPLIIDVRSTTARRIDPRWIPGARHIPLEDVDAALRSLPRDKDVVVYCACPSEASAARVSKLLINRGFTRVRPLQGGIDAWVAAGHAVDGP